MRCGGGGGRGNGEEGGKGKQGKETRVPFEEREVEGKKELVISLRSTQGVLNYIISLKT